MKIRAARGYYLLFNHLNRPAVDFAGRQAQPLLTGTCRHPKQGGL